MSASITLWRENKIAGEYQLSFDELLDRFEMSPVFTDFTGRPFEFMLTMFIGSPEPAGLNSVHDPADRPTWNALLDRADERGVVSTWVRAQAAWTD